MKKLLLGACALMAIGAISCGKCDSDKCSTTATDSLSTAYGTYVGSMLQGDMTQMYGHDKEKKAEFMKGLQEVFGGAADNTEKRMGMQVALQIFAELQQLKDQGIEMDQKLILSSFKEAFLKDSIPYDEISDRALDFQRLFVVAKQKATETTEAAKASAPEALEANEAATKYLEEQKAINPEIKTAASGLSYYIENLGEGEHPTETSTVEVNYTGKLIDGTVFDTTDGRGPDTFNLAGVVPGFREGIELLGKGGKATLYIPGTLGYGAQGMPQAGIGPNAMLVFDVELVSIQ